MEAFVLDCTGSLRASKHKTCFHCFCSNLVNFYRIKINFNVFWEPLKNLKLWLHFCYSVLASFAVAGVFTFARSVFLFLHSYNRRFSSDLNIVYVSDIGQCLCIVYSSSTHPLSSAGIVRHSMCRHCTPCTRRTL